MIHLRTEERCPGATVVLGSIHRRVRVSHQRLARVTQLRQRNSDARGNKDLTVVQLYRLGQDLRDASSNILRCSGPGQPDELVAQNEEFVAAKTGDDVTWTQHASKPLRDRHQDFIADRVPEPVVDELEVIEVNEQHRDAAADVLSFVQRAGHEICKGRSIGKARHRIVARLVGEAVTRGLSVGDVLDLLDHVQRAIFPVPHHRDVQAHPDNRSVGPQVALLNAIAVDVAPRQTLTFRLTRRPIIGMGEVSDGHTDELLTRAL